MSDLIKYLRNEEANIQAYVPEHALKTMSVTRMVNLVGKVVLRNPDLVECSEQSWKLFCIQMAEWGTDRIGAGGVWPVAFGKKITPMPDYRFLIAQCKRAGVIKHAYADAVYENDEFQASRGMMPTLIHNLAPSNRGKVIGVYCVYVLPDDTRDFVYMPWEEVLKIKARSKAKSGPWQTDEVQMGLKTVLKRAMKPFEGDNPILTSLIAADNTALGYIDAEVVERQPVAMPVEKQVSETTETKEKAKPKKKTTAKKGSTAKKKPAAKKDPKKEDGGDQPASVAVPTEGEPDENADMVEGLISKVTTKGGTNKNGDYTVYGVILEGQRYGTFDDPAGQYAEQCANDNVPVKIAVEKSGNFWNMVGIWPLQEAATEPDEVLSPNEGTGEAEDEDKIPY